MSTQPEQVAVIGAGAIGCLLAAQLAAAGHRAVLCGRTPLTHVELTADGDP